MNEVNIMYRQEQFIKWVLEIATQEYNGKLDFI